MATKRILIVDDEPNVVKSCARMLELQDFDVKGTTNGAEALAFYKKERFDLALVDLQMPDMDGLELLASLKAYDPSATVVIFTAYGTKESVVEALRLGASEFLEKPLETKSLAATVRRILEQEGAKVVRGNLHTLTLPSIVQINCAERNQACLRLKRAGEQGSIFFADGNVVHAVLGPQVGEEAIYELLNWEDGDFELEMGVSPPERTITVGWSGLLLEGMRRIDESAVDLDEIEQPEEFFEEPEELFQELEEFSTEPKEVVQMASKRRSEILAEHLESLLSASPDVNGAVVVGNDGLVLASNITVGGHEASRVGAEGAALLGLSKRTLGSLKCGDFQTAILQGKDGWVVAVDGGPQAMVLGMTDADVNLGMVLLEMRDISSDVAETLA